MDVWIRDKYLFAETFLGHIVSVKTHLSSRFYMQMRKAGLKNDL